MTKKVLEICYDGSDMCKLYARVYYKHGTQYIEGVEDINEATGSDKIREYAKEFFTKLHSYKKDIVSLQEVIMT